MALISCNFPSFHFPPKPPTIPRIPSLSPPNTQLPKLPLKPCKFTPQFSSISTRFALQICHNSLNSQNPKDPIPEKGFPAEGNTTGDGNGGNSSDWTTSILLFALWAALIYYVFALTPDQTPFRDMYFLQKLLNLRGDDGFHMNEVLVSLWYIMGLWPLVYSMLLLPSGRSSRSKIPVWPFLVLSCFGGAYALIPYFVLWRPPPPALDEAELGRWPLNILESKITAGILIAAGLGVIGYAGLADGDVWKEFYQYFRESKFIHITSIDFSLLSVFAPFWVYNDMTARKWELRM
ncbi:uncharacterized protein LOC131255841 isoform X2 [Magnolia sinica]|uniref:uncharacterized protein LOC131255841 isoform X2 n=1 Tax=Magnolia sinica TaxID=86752 RepID=UPI0026585567|nr:uncharacterized protein LOC131255841 isoform X2 [Magnolia sinica]